MWSILYKRCLLSLFYLFIYMYIDFALNELRILVPLLFWKVYFSLSDTSFPCKSKEEDEVLGSRTRRCPCNLPFFFLVRKKRERLSCWLQYWWLTGKYVVLHSREIMCYNWRAYGKQYWVCLSAKKVQVHECIHQSYSSWHPQILVNKIFS